MRIAYIIENFYNSGGMERNLAVKTNWLVDNTDYDISIIVARQNNKLPFFKLNEKIHLIDLNVSNDLSLAKGWKDSLKSHFQVNHYDILVSDCGLDVHFLPLIAGTAKTVAEFQFNYNIFDFWHTQNRNSFLNRVKGKLSQKKFVMSAKKFDKFVALTSTDAENWRRYLSKEKVDYIHNPITIEDSSKSDCSSKKVISIGRLDKQKGFDILIEIWKLVHSKHPDWTITIYGEGGERESLEKLIRKNNLQDVFILGGQVSNVQEKLSESSILAFSSRAEGFGLVLVEAMSCGLPIVTFDCPIGPGEIVQDGVNGYVIPMGQISLFAKRIIDLIEDPDLRLRMSKQALVRAKDFDLNGIMKKWVSVYEGLFKV